MTARDVGHAYTPATDTAPGQVVVTIRHLDTDSYSRSVDPAAMRAAGRLVRGAFYPVAHWTLTDVRYSVGESPDDGRGNGRPYCLSEAVFRLDRLEVTA